MATQGFVRNRRHQFARQSGMNDAAAATRVYGFKGVPSVDRKWTDPDVDDGSIDPVQSPYLTAPDIAAPLTDPALRYNSIPLLMCGVFGGNVDPTGAGTAKTWHHKPASTTVDPIDPFTYEFGDDVLTDWYQLVDGLITQLTITGSEGLGPITTSMSWMFGTANSTGSTDHPVVGSVPAAISLATDEAIVYLKDMGVYIATAYGSIASGQVLNALHSFVLTIGQPYDQKRFANGDQLFDVDDYGRGPRTISLAATFAKTDDTVGTGSESDAWMSDTVVNRYIRLKFTSKVLAESPSTFYSWLVDFPCRYYTREEAEVGGNTAIVLTAHAYLEDATFGGVFESTCVNTLTSADLGEEPS